MSITVEEFLAQTGAETVGDTIILGVAAERRVVGFLSPAFTLTAEGTEIMAALVASVPVVEAVAVAAKRRVKKAESRNDVDAATGLVEPVVEFVAPPLEPVVEAVAPVLEPVVVPVVEAPVVEVVTPVVETPAV